MQHLQPNTTLQGGKYRIERVLGLGGFGITYLAVQTSLYRYVAIKELFIGGSGQAINDRRGNQVVVTNSANQASFNQQKEKFKKEALRLANLNHPNLVKVHEFFEENGTAYYVMDYIEGESLRTKLNREGTLSESLVLKYLQQLLPALEVAHRQSIWHLDIKPENIMVDIYGYVYLIDFGASKHIEQNSTLTTSLALAYTKGYCPPELADLTYSSQNDLVQALKEIGPWTDIYALGATMYNLLTDSIPPSSNRLYKDGHNAFTFPSHISSSTQDLIVWMMKPDREDRPQCISDLQKLQNRIPKEDERTKIEHSNHSDEVVRWLSDKDQLRRLQVIVGSSYSYKELEKLTAKDIYDIGKEFETNHHKERAVKCILRSAAMGYLKAQLEVAHCYVSGYGVPQDLSVAANWYRKAAEQGSIEARSALQSLNQQLYVKEKNPQNQETEHLEVESEGPFLKFGRILIGCLLILVGLLFIGECHELYQWTVVIMIIIGGVFLLFYKGT